MLRMSSSLTAPARTPSAARRLHAARVASLGLLAGLLGLAAGGCPPGDTPSPGGYNNTTDPNNGGATYLGSAACAACHPDYAELTRLHGHANALTRVQGAAPVFPSGADRAGVPAPPAGKPWTDVSYVIGGYTHGARFVNQNGYILTDATAGGPALWQIPFPPSDTAASFTAYAPGGASPLPLAFAELARLSTGPQPTGHADARPGIQGTWVEPGVRCEACHGPGSRHVPNPAARALFVDLTPQTCARCHTGGDAVDTIAARGGYIVGNAQAAELRASGAHAAFSCGTCHEPHASATYDRARGIRNDCTACHGDVNIPLHAGVVFELGDYREPVTCVSCHMPFTGLATAAATPDAVGADGRMGDVRGHIFRINPDATSYTAMFTAGGDSVLKNGQGRAAVSLDFVCLRCHSGKGNAFRLAPSQASDIATDMHTAP
jgi:hypothetical protein